jgi:hypothetical protein
MAKRKRMRGDKIAVTLGIDHGEYWFYGKDCTPEEMIPCDQDGSSLGDCRTIEEFNARFEIVKKESKQVRALPPLEIGVGDYGFARKSGYGVFWVTILTVKRK